MTGTTGLIAGASAGEEADQLALSLDLVDDQIQSLLTVRSALQRQVRNWRVGERGEQNVASELGDNLASPWVILPDRSWPGTRRANIDILVLGPGGVFVIDVKRWAEPALVHGRLLCGTADATDEAAKVRDQADAIAQALEDLGLSPNEVVPMLVLDGHDLAPVSVAGTIVLGSGSLAAALARRGDRLDAAQLEILRTRLDEAAPPRLQSTASRPAPRRPVRGPRGKQVPGQQALVTEESIADAYREAAERGPIEQWMVWLDPAQAPLVRRDWSGPARIRGAAGTGKTVVALHRAAFLARRGRDRVLMTSFVRTLPDVHRSLFLQIGADVAERVEFTSLHGWALAYLRRRGVRLQVEQDRAQRALFPLARRSSGADQALRGVSVPDSYWWDEVTCVIKGRGITSFDDYASLARTGRRVPLQESHRRAVWTLYEDYQQRLANADIHDWADVLLITQQLLATDPQRPSYSGVVVDEVQDLSGVALRILALLSDPAPGGLLLVGDGQQAIYPGATTLAEVGISVAGRAVVLERNYRNGRAILDRALRVVRDDEFDDLEETRIRGDRAVATARPGGHIEEHSYATLADMTRGIVEHLADRADTGRLGDIAIACPSIEDARRWRDALEAHGLPAMDLSDYRGRTTDAVKIGTYHRLKGLEFAEVIVPDHDRAVWPQAPAEGEDAYRERSSLQRRQLFVAMTRARDGLWLATRAS